MSSRAHQTDLLCNAEVSTVHRRQRVRGLLVLAFLQRCVHLLQDRPVPARRACVMMSMINKSTASVLHLKVMGTRTKTLTGNDTRS